MAWMEEPGPKEKAEREKAYQRWVEAGCPMPSVAYYGPSLLDKIKGVQPMKETGDAR